MKSETLFGVVICMYSVFAVQVLDCTGRQCLVKTRSLTKQMIEIQAAQLETRRVRQATSFEGVPGIGFEDDLGSQYNVRAISGQGENGQEKGRQGREKGQEHRERKQENGRRGFDNAQKGQAPE